MKPRGIRIYLNRLETTNKHANFITKCCTKTTVTAIRRVTVNKSKEEIKCHLADVLSRYEIPKSGIFAENLQTNAREM